MFWFSLQVLSEIFLILRRVQRDVLKFSRNVPLSCLILIKLDLSRLIFFFKYPQISNFVTVHCGPVVPLDRQTWQMTMIILTFHSFANAPQNWTDTNIKRSDGRHRLPVMWSFTAYALKHKGEQKLFFLFFGGGRVCPEACNDENLKSLLTFVLVILSSEPAVRQLAGFPGLWFLTSRHNSMKTHVNCHPRSTTVTELVISLRRRPVAHKCPRAHVFPNVYRSVYLCKVQCVLRI